MGGPLGVTGLTTLSGGVKTNSLTSTATNGAMTIAGDQTSGGTVTIGTSSTATTLNGTTTASLSTTSAAVTQTTGTSGTTIATTAFVANTAALKANIASPTFTGTVNLPGTNAASLSVTGNETVTGTLGVTGLATLSGGISTGTITVPDIGSMYPYSGTLPDRRIIINPNTINTSVNGQLELGRTYGLYNLPYSSSTTDGGFVFRTTNSDGTSGTVLTRIQNTPANTNSDPPGSYTGTNIMSSFNGGYQTSELVSITGGYRYSTTNTNGGKISLNFNTIPNFTYKIVFTVKVTTADTNLYIELGNGNVIFNFGLVGTNVFKTYTAYFTSNSNNFAYLGVNGVSNMVRTIEYKWFSIEPFYEMTASSLSATSLNARNSNTSLINAKSVLIGEEILNYAPFDKFPLQVVGSSENGLAIFPKINGLGQISNIAMYAPFITNFDNDTYPKRCADIYAGRSANWGGEYLSFGVGVNGTNYDHIKTITRMSINGAANTTVTIGQLNYRGTGDTTTLNAETSRHTIQFPCYWNSDSAFIGSSIASINKQSFTSGNRSDLQSADLAFSTRASSGGTLGERMRILDTGRVGINTNNPTALLDVDGAIVWTSSAARSDRRIKTDILDVEDQQALMDIRRLKPKTYGYKDSKERGNERVYGFIAQDVKEVLQYAGDVTKDYIPNIYEEVDIVNDILTFTTFNTSSLERNARLGGCLERRIG